MNITPTATGARLLLVAEQANKMDRSGDVAVPALGDLDLPVCAAELVAVFGGLRAPGFREAMVRRAVEGVVGTLLWVLTTWLLYNNSPAFGSVDGPFPIAWLEIGLTVGVTLIASLAVTAQPGRRAARIRPAIAVRVAD